MTKTKSYTFHGVDGNHRLTFSETEGRSEVVVSIQQNDDHECLATMRLSAEDWRTLGELRYSLDVKAV